MIGVETKAVAGLLVSSHSSGDLGLKPAQSGDAFFAVHDFSANMNASTVADIDRHHAAAKNQATSGTTRSSRCTRQVQSRARRETSRPRSRRTGQTGREAGRARVGR